MRARGQAAGLRSRWPRDTPGTDEQPPPSGGGRTWGAFVDDHPDLDADDRGQEAPAGEERPAEAAPSVPAPGGDGGASGEAPGSTAPEAAPARAPGQATREAPEVSVPIWRLTPRQRAELLRIVEAGGRTQRRDVPREQLSSLIEAGYLAVYDDGLVMLTPAALRAITIEVDRRAAARDAAPGERPQRPRLSS